MGSGPQSAAEHWNRVYSRGDTGRSWYQAHATASMRLITRHVPDAGAALIDVGGGASTLVDDLLAAGRSRITVMDVAPRGLSLARARLGSSAARVRWLVQDVLSWRPNAEYAVWHDRAVLHFLTEDADRTRYVASLLAATRPGSVAILGVFGPEGPQECSALPVRRYDEADLVGLLSDRFELVESFRADHTTPSGGVQQFVWTASRRIR